MSSDDAVMVALGYLLVFFGGGLIFAMWLNRSARRMREEQGDQSD